MLKKASLDQQSDGDERMTKDGENIRKFSKEAMTLGDDVYANEGNALDARWPFVLVLPL